MGPDGTAYEGIHHLQIQQYLVDMKIWPDIKKPLGDGWYYGFVNEAGKFVGQIIKWRCFMSVHFDEQVFRSLDGTKLNIYVDDIEANGRIGISERVISNMMKEIRSLSILKSCYVLYWAVALRLPGVSDAALILLDRAGREEGGEIAILKLLRDAHDFTTDHLHQIENMTLRDPWGGVAEQITLLRARLISTPPT